VKSCKSNSNGNDHRTLQPNHKRSFRGITAFLHEKTREKKKKNRKQNRGKREREARKTKIKEKRMIAALTGLKLAHP